MRKFAITFLTFAIVMMLALSACGVGNADDAPTPAPTPEATPTPTPTPEPTPLLQDDTLVGTWAWVEAGAYLYNFHADGEGTRGFVPATETFQWRVEDDSHLIITTSIAEESWTYVIDGDMLTISSRQIPGMEFSYFRVQEGMATEGGPIRGGWEGNIYTSEYLGFSFTLPEGWRAHSEADIAAVMGMAVDVLGGQGAYIPANVDMFVDMTASSAATGANVQIMFERMPFPITEEEYIEFSAESVEHLGGSVVIIPGTTRIGSYNWHSFGSELDFGGVMIFGRQFVHIQDGFIRSIIISYIEGTETLEDILPMFGDL